MADLPGNVLLHYTAKVRVNSWIVSLVTNYAIYELEFLFQFLLSFQWIIEKGLELPWKNINFQRKMRSIKNKGASLIYSLNVIISHPNNVNRNSCNGNLYKWINFSKWNCLNFFSIFLLSFSMFLLSFFGRREKTELFSICFVDF